MKSNLLDHMFHVESNRDNGLRMHYPSGRESWWKLNADKTNNNSTYKPGPGLPKGIIYKIRSIYHDLIKQTDLRKVLTFVSLPCLQVRICDAISNINIGMKASVLTYEKLDIIPDNYTIKSCKKSNAKRLPLADS